MQRLQNITNDDDDDNVYQTPTSPRYKIPIATECLPAPGKRFHMKRVYEQVGLAIQRGSRCGDQLQDWRRQCQAEGKES